jgi:TPR repeat protein
MVKHNSYITPQIFLQMKKIIYIILVSLSITTQAQVKTTAVFNLQELEKKATAGDAEAQYTIGISYLYGYNKLVKDEKKAINYFQQSANKGNGNGENALGVCYKYGTGVEKNIERAIEFYTKAVEHANMKAQYNIGVLYQNGEGVVKDEAKAFSLYGLSAAQDYKLAQYRIGVFYLYGKSVPKDVNKAREWFDKAIVNNENANIFKWVADFYAMGWRDIPDDKKKAFELYSKAVALGDDDANIELAKMYDYSYEEIKNKKKAADIYQKYADKGNVECIMSLGRLYDVGDASLPQNYARAMELFKKAAALNNNKAQAQVGYYYEYGTGVAVNNEEAMKWYKLAEANGNKAIKFQSKIYNPNYNPNAGVITITPGGNDKVFYDVIKDKYWYVELSRGDEKKIGYMTFCITSLVGDKVQGNFSLYNYLNTTNETLNLIGGTIEGTKYAAFNNFNLNFNIKYNHFDMGESAVGTTFNAIINLIPYQNNVYYLESNIKKVIPFAAYESFQQMPANINNTNKSLAYNPTNSDSQNNGLNTRNGQLITCALCNGTGKIWQYELREVASNVYAGTSKIITTTDLGGNFIRQQRVNDTYKQYSTRGESVEHKCYRCNGTGKVH